MIITKKLSVVMKAILKFIKCPHINISQDIIGNATDKKTSSLYYKQLGLVLHYIKSLDEDNFMVFAERNNLNTYIRQVSVDRNSYYWKTFRAINDPALNQLPFSEMCLKLKKKATSYYDLAPFRAARFAYFQALDLLKELPLWDIVNPKTPNDNYYKHSDRTLLPPPEKTLFFPICYPGSKKRQVSAILPMLKVNKISMLVEPFAGTGIVSLNAKKKNPNLKIWLNDKSKQMFALLKTLQTNPSLIIDNISRIKPDSTVWEDYRFNLNKEKDVEQLGWMFYYVMIYSFNQLGITYYPYNHCKDESKVKKIQQVHDLLKEDVVITNFDYKKVIAKKIKGEKVAYYLDPPYFGAKTFYYYAKFTEHDTLHEKLSEVESPWVLSYGDCLEIREIYNNYKIKRVKVSHPMGGNHRYFKELLISN